MPMTKIFLEIMPDKYLNSTYNCHKLSFCDNFDILPNDFTNFQTRILKETPPFIWEKPMNDEKIKIVQISDLHLDPYYTTVFLLYTKYRM